MAAFRRSRINSEMGIRIDQNRNTAQKPDFMLVADEIGIEQNGFVARIHGSGQYQQ